MSYLYFGFCDIFEKHEVPMSAAVRRGGIAEGGRHAPSECGNGGRVRARAGGHQARPPRRVHSYHYVCCCLMRQFSDTIRLSDSLSQYMPFDVIQLRVQVPPLRNDPPTIDIDQPAVGMFH